MSAQPEIVVVGSANLDIVVPVQHHPGAGETVLGGDHRLVPGGKGANQATATSRLGRRVAIVGRVGDDDAGATLRKALDDAGVDTTALLATADAPSGIALISVADDGDNAIVVSPGANARLTPADIAAAGDLITGCDAVLLQFETPMETVAAAARAAAGLVVLNPAPAAALDPALLDHVDVLVPNEIELAQLTERPPATDLDEVADQARQLGVTTVVVTLGERGALAIADGTVLHQPAPVIEPVDTTGAGDAFCAALTDGLLRGRLDTALAWAVRVGAATALRAGAGPSLPTPDEVERLLSSDPRSPNDPAQHDRTHQETAQPEREAP